MLLLHPLSPLKSALPLLDISRAILLLLLLLLLLRAYVAAAAAAAPD